MPVIYRTPIGNKDVHIQHENISVNFSIPMVTPEPYVITDDLLSGSGDAVTMTPNTNAVGLNQMWNGGINYDHSKVQSGTGVINVYEDSKTNDLFTKLFNFIQQMPDGEAFRKYYFNLKVIKSSQSSSNYSEAIGCFFKTYAPVNIQATNAPRVNNWSYVATEIYRNAPSEASLENMINNSNKLPQSPASFNSEYYTQQNIRANEQQEAQIQREHEAQEANESDEISQEQQLDNQLERHQEISNLTNQLNDIKASINSIQNQHGSSTRSQLPELKRKASDIARQLDNVKGR